MKKHQHNSLSFCNFSLFFMLKKIIEAHIYTRKVFLYTKSTLRDTSPLRKYGFPGKSLVKTCFEGTERFNWTLGVKMGDPRRWKKGTSP